MSDTQPATQTAQIIPFPKQRRKQTPPAPSSLFAPSPASPAKQPTRSMGMPTGIIPPSLMPRLAPKPIMTAPELDSATASLKRLRDAMIKQGAAISAFSRSVADLQAAVSSGGGKATPKHEA